MVPTVFAKGITVSQHSILLKKKVCFSIALLVSMAQMESSQRNLAFLFPWLQTKTHVDTLLNIGCQVTVVFTIEKLWLIWNDVDY